MNLNKKKLEFGISIQGDVVKKDNKTQFIRTIDLQLPASMTGTTSVSPKISIAKEDQTNFWVKLTQIPPIPFLNIDEFVGRWIKVNLSNIDDTYGVDTSLTQGENLQKIQQIKNDIINIYINNSFLMLTELEPTQIDDINTYHYGWKIDKTIRA